MPDGLLHSRVWGGWRHLPVRLLCWLQQHGTVVFSWHGAGRGARQPEELLPGGKGRRGQPLMFPALCLLSASPRLRWRAFRQWAGRLLGPPCRTRQVSKQRHRADGSGKCRDAVYAPETQTAVHGTHNGCREWDDAAGSELPVHRRKARAPFIREDSSKPATDMSSASSLLSSLVFFSPRRPPPFLCSHSAFFWVLFFWL